MGTLLYIILCFTLGIALAKGLDFYKEFQRRKRWKRWNSNRYRCMSQIVRVLKLGDIVLKLGMAKCTFGVHQLGEELFDVYVKQVDPSYANLNGFVEKLEGYNLFKVSFSLMLPKISLKKYMELKEQPDTKYTAYFGSADGYISYTVGPNR
jgi:hypothetical protein